MSYTIIFLIILAFGVGYVWKKWGLSFSSGVIWSIVLSPIGGIILGFIWKTIKDRRQKVGKPS